MGLRKKLLSILLLAFFYHTPGWGMVKVGAEEFLKLTKPACYQGYCQFAHQTVENKGFMISFFAELGVSPGLTGYKMVVEFGHHTKKCSVDIKVDRKLYSRFVDVITSIESDGSKQLTRNQRSMIKFFFNDLWAEIPKC